MLSATGQWQSHGPFGIAISDQTARSLARRTRTSPHVTVPVALARCVAAQSVAVYGLSAWELWPGNAGTMTAAWWGFGTGPSFGRFRCTGVAHANGTVTETCAHAADRHAGAITAVFTISPVP
jgi:hypothetical protein